MTDSEIRAFKNEMKNYRFYQNQVESLTEQENTIYHQLGGYKSPDPSKIPGSYNPNMNIHKAELGDKLEAISRRKAAFQSKIDQLDEVLDQLPTEIRERIIDIYVKGKSYRDVANSVPIDISNLYRKINAALKKVS